MKCNKFPSTDSYMLGSFDVWWLRRPWALSQNSLASYQPSDSTNEKVRA